MHAASFKNGQPLNANANAPAPANGPNVAAVAGMHNQTPQSNGAMDSGGFDTGNLGLDDLQPDDMLDNFDFDTFLNNAEEPNFGDFMDFTDGAMLAES